MKSLIHNPIFRIVGVAAILYFALFKNNRDVDSLSNRLKPEKVKSDFADMSAKSTYIMENLRKAQEVEANKVNANLIIKDIKTGSGKVANCNDKIDFNYEISSKDKKILQNTKTTLIIGGAQLPLEIENNIIGMKQNGTRSITVPYDYKSKDAKLSEFLSQNHQNIIYQISLLKVEKSQQNYSCK